MNYKVRICIALDERLLREFDKAVKKDCRSTRTEAIISLMRRYIQEMNEADEDKPGD